MRERPFLSLLTDAREQLQLRPLLELEPMGDALRERSWRTLEAAFPQVESCLMFWRAVVSNLGIPFEDEPTASLQVETESLVQRQIHNPLVQAALLRFTLPSDAYPIDRGRQQATIAGLLDLMELPAAVTKGLLRAVSGKLTWAEIVELTQLNRNGLQWSNLPQGDFTLCDAIRRLQYDQSLSAAWYELKWLLTEGCLRKQYSPLFVALLWESAVRLTPCTTSANDLTMRALGDVDAVIERYPAALAIHAQWNWASVPLWLKSTLEHPFESHTMDRVTDPRRVLLAHRLHQILEKGQDAAVDVAGQLVQRPQRLTDERIWPKQATVALLRDAAKTCRLATNRAEVAAYFERALRCDFFRDYLGCEEQCALVRSVGEWPLSERLAVLACLSAVCDRDNDEYDRTLRAEYLTVLSSILAAWREPNVETTICTLISEGNFLFGGLLRTLEMWTGKDADYNGTLFHDAMATFISNGALLPPSRLGPVIRYAVEHGLSPIKLLHTEYCLQAALTAGYKPTTEDLNQPGIWRCLVSGEPIGHNLPTLHHWPQWPDMRRLLLSPISPHRDWALAELCAFQATWQQTVSQQIGAIDGVDHWLVESLGPQLMDDPELRTLAHDYGWSLQSRWYVDELRELLTREPYWSCVGELQGKAITYCLESDLVRRMDAKRLAPMLTTICTVEGEVDLFTLYGILLNRPDRNHKADLEPVPVELFQACCPPTEHVRDFLAEWCALNASRLELTWLIQAINAYDLYELHSAIPPKVHMALDSGSDWLVTLAGSILDKNT